MLELLVSSIAAFLALLTSIYLLVSKPRSVHLVLLAMGFAACAALEILDVMGRTHPEDILFWKKGVLAVEGALPVFYAWSGALAGRRFRKLVLGLRLVLVALPALFVAGLILSPDQVFFSPDFAEEKLLFLKNPGYFFYLGLLLCLTFSLFMYEQFFAGLGRKERWHSKFEVLGVGAILAVQIIYYSQGLLYRSLDMSLVWARSTALITGVLLLAFSRLLRGHFTRISISREITNRSIVVLVVGVYLFGLGLVGEGMRYFGQGSQRGFLIVLGLLGGLAVIVVLFSENLRRKTRVFLNKHFFREKFDYRVHWLEFTRRLSRAQTAKELSQAILEFYCYTFGLRGGALALRATEFGDYHVVDTFEWPELNAPIRADGTLVKFLEQHKRVFNSDDPNAENLRNDCELFDICQPRFIVPLIFENQLAGMVVLGQPIDSSETFIYEDFDLMKALAFQASAVLHNQRLSDQLSNAREMAAIGKVAAFVMHDLKNSVSNLALLVDNARNHMDNPEFQTDMLTTLESSVMRMRGLIDRLKNFERRKELKLEFEDLKVLVQDLLAGIFAKSVVFDGVQVFCWVDREEFGKVVHNLVLNGLDATEGKGPVVLEVGCSEMVYLRCSDRGCGMTGEFIRDHLFRPFETTKSKGFGIGLYQCRQIVEAHGGHISVKSEIGKGTEFTVWLPLPGDRETPSPMTFPSPA